MNLRVNQILQNKVLSAKRVKNEPKLALVPPTSNIAERSFSIAKYILTPERKRLLSHHVKALMFLKLNPDFYDAKLASIFNLHF